MTDSEPMPQFETREEMDAAPRTTDGETCEFNHHTYRRGETICWNHTEFECGKNGWFKTGRGC
jgi:hypothetical protein